ncbi:MAG: phage tail tube protein, partial [Thermoleophilia bacterium]|nr:phage tail tube protein [Gaiellaceae bacterium]MDW8339681.1 phage tail tube protein [Thermoleophilia bacterium]
LEGQTDPASPSPSSYEPLVYPNVTVTFDGSTADIVESFTLTSERAAQVIQGDTGMAASDVVTGRWGVSGTLRILFETDAIWRKFLTGSPTGTTHSQTLAVAALNITATRSSSDEVSWDIDNAEIRNVSLVPDPSGAPLFYDVEFSARPDPTIANTLTVVAKNTTSSYTS